MSSKETRFDWTLGFVVGLPQIFLWGLVFDDWVLGLIFGLGTIPSMALAFGADRGCQERRAEADGADSAS